MVSTTKALFVPAVDTTANRDLLPLGSPYSIIFNQQTGQFDITSDSGSSWGEIPTGASSAPAQLVYASNDGSDVTGDGSYNNPYATVSFSVASITDASKNKPYKIQLISGVYLDTNFSPKPYVSIDGGNSFYTVTNLVSADASWSGGTGGGLMNIENFFGLDFTAGMSFTVTGNTFPAILTFRNVSFQVNIFWIFDSDLTGECAVTFDGISSNGGRISLGVTNAKTFINNSDFASGALANSNASNDNLCYIRNSTFKETFGIDISDGTYFATIMSNDFQDDANFDSSVTGTLNATWTGSTCAGTLQADGAGTTLNIDGNPKTISEVNSPVIVYDTPTYNNLKLDGETVSFTGEVISATYAPCPALATAIAGATIKQFATLKASTTVAFRVEEILTADLDSVGIVGFSTAAAMGAGDPVTMCGQNLVTVITDSVTNIALGDPIEKSGDIAGTVTTDIPGPGTFGVAAETAATNSAFKIWLIKNEVF